MTDKITQNARNNAETTDRGSETDYMSIPAGPSGMARRGEKNRPRPGPASSKKRYNTRSRSGSASSSTSVSSSASTAIMAERKSRREAAIEVNRLAIQLERVDGVGSPIVSVISDSDESDGEAEYREKRRPPKRKLSEDNEEEMAEEDAKRKQGRPQTTGLYVKRAEAIEKVNQKKREEAELDNAKIIKALSSGQIFSKMKRDLEDAVDELSDAPTADIASQARECMAGVLKVARCSRNLQGGMVKILNHAAVKGAASTEVLRTRADSAESDNEATRQLKGLRRELEQARREAQTAKEEAARAGKEAERLREELAKLQAEGKSGRRRGRVIVEDSPSPPLSPDRGQADNNACQAKPAEASATTRTGESPMEVEIAAEEVAREEPSPKYCDERRKKEILPPPEEWPAAVRPALKGRVKILEDRPLTGHRVILAKGRTEEKKAETSTATREPKAERSGAELLLEQLTPLLKKWLEENLGSRGLSKRPEGGKETTVSAGRQQTAGPKPGRKTEKPARPQTGGAEGTREKVVQSTVVPNKALWSEVVGGKSSKRIPPPAERQQPGVGPKVTDASKAKNTEEWQTVARKTKVKKSASTKIAVTPKQGEAGPPSGGKRPAKEGKRANADPPPRGAGREKKKAPKRRPPRTAAVTLTCPPDGYAEAMRVAQGAIDLKELGIKELRPKRAATGAIVLEVPGPDGAERAAVLKSRMEEALKDMEGVRVARPVKTADMRVRDLLASVSVDDVKGAISSVGDCPLHEIRAGEIRTAPNGLGTLWVQCPLRAANKVVAAGRLGIG